MTPREINCTAHARVTVTLSIEVPSTWLGSAKVEQIHEQAKENANRILQEAFKDPNRKDSVLQGIRLVEMSKVDIYLTSKELP